MATGDGGEEKEIGGCSETGDEMVLQVKVEGVMVALRGTWPLPRPPFSSARAPSLLPMCIVQEKHRSIDGRSENAGCEVLPLAAMMCRVVETQG